MKILVVCHFGLYSDFDNSFVHPQAIEFARMGHEVKVLIPIAYGKKDWDGNRIKVKRRTQDGVELLPLRYISLSKYGEKKFNTHSAIIASKVRLYKDLDKFQPDIIHAHTLGFDSSLGAWLKNRYNCPLVVTTHGSDTTRPYLQGKKDMLKAFCDTADCVVGVSSSLINKLKDTGTTTQLRVILNGFRPQHLLENTRKIPCSIIQVGHLIQQKGFDITIRAFAEIKRNFPNATLTIIGQGIERESLEELCCSLDIENSVSFLGQVKNSRVMQEMSKHQYFVMPSTLEGFGIVYLEAMANNCITIGTIGEGISDLIKDRNNGFLVPATDPTAIYQIITWCEEHPFEAKSIAQQGASDAKELTWEKNASSYDRLFKEICL